MGDLAPIGMRRSLYAVLVALPVLLFAFMVFVPMVASASRRVAATVLQSIMVVMVGVFCTHIVSTVYWHPNPLAASPGDVARDAATFIVELFGPVLHTILSLFFAPQQHTTCSASSKNDCVI